MRRIFVAAILFIAFMATARADYKDGVAAYERGDYATALREWRPLARQGYADAQFSLGFLYAQGWGVPQVYTEAVRLYRMAAEQGDADAQFSLGLMYRKGQGVPQDYTVALKWGHMWFNLAAAQGHEQARENRDIISDGMTPAQITEAQRLAREWRPKKQ